MNDEQAYALMMEALDGVLDPDQSAELTQWLSQHPDEAREFDAMQRIDTMLQIAPPAVVPARFAKRTLQQIPNARNRRLIMFLSYLVLFVGGLSPILLVVFIGSQFDTLAPLQVISNGITAALRTGVSQPTTISWLMVMISTIFIWAFAYHRYANRVQPLVLTS